MSVLKGYMGKVLKIDLSVKKHSIFPWTDADRKRTIGGKIMAADILFSHIRPGMKAFDADNWIVVTTGPCTGSGCPNTSRFNISTISPHRHHYILQLRRRFRPDPKAGRV